MLTLREIVIYPVSDGKYITTPVVVRRYEAPIITVKDIKR